MKPEEYTMLVVDDNDENRDVLSRRLLKKGFHVLVAEGGPQALSLIDSQPVDLVLLDIMMPGMTGIEVLEIVTVNTADSAMFLAGGATLDASQETTRDPHSTLKRREPVVEGTKERLGVRKTGS